MGVDKNLRIAQVVQWPNCGSHELGKRVQFPNWGTALFFRLLWPCIVSKVRRENRKLHRAQILHDSAPQPLPTTFNKTRAIYTKCSNRVFVLVKMGILMPETCWDRSYCSHPTRQHPAIATNHIQQNQNNTPNAVTGPLFSWRWSYWCPNHVETEVNSARIPLRSAPQPIPTTSSRTRTTHKMQ